jgi:hypothetical protein
MARQYIRHPAHIPIQIIRSDHFSTSFRHVVTHNISHGGLACESEQSFLPGDGFAELGLLDEDGNGFIDEGDSAYEDLMVWLKTDDRDITYSLSDAGIGALSVDGMAGDFAIRDQDGNEQAMIRETGVYVTESGGVGVLQQVDVASDSSADAESQLA